MSTVAEPLQPIEAFLPAVTPEEIRDQLERILLSEPFRHSKRHPRFLRFVVEKYLSGTAGEIKERLIGIEVFDRPHDYDLATDPIVRVAAGEIRKRLAQYYLESSRAGELRFELQSGSYVPTFIWLPSAHRGQPEAPKAAAAEEHLLLAAGPETALPSTVEEIVPRAGRVRPLWVLVAICAAIVCAALYLFLPHTSRQQRNLEAFWKPLLQSSGTLICVGDLNFLMPEPTPAQNLSLEDLMRSRNHLGQSNVAVVGRMASMLGSEGISSQVILADNANLTDLRRQPSLLIGAFDNQWSQRILEGARYRIHWDPAQHRAQITDGRNPTQTSWFVDFTAPLDGIPRDYAVVARISSALTGQPVIVLAGVGPYGTIAASEFVSNPAYFDQFIANAPRDWQNKTVEILLTTAVVDGRSGPPQILGADVH